MAEAAATVERDLQIVGACVEINISSAAAPPRRRRRRDILVSTQVGATAIEDKLQEGAPDCIAELADAGIRS